MPVLAALQTGTDHVAELQKLRCILRSKGD